MIITYYHGSKRREEVAVMKTTLRGTGRKQAGHPENPGNAHLPFSQFTVSITPAVLW